MRSNISMVPILISGLLWVPGIGMGIIQHFITIPVLVAVWMFEQCLYCYWYESLAGIGICININFTSGVGIGMVVSVKHYLRVILEPNKGPKESHSS